MTNHVCVAVFGASGFLGSRIVQALEARGATTVSLAAPRLKPMAADDVVEFVRSSLDLRENVRASIGHADAVINAAGIPGASSRDEPALMAANAACAAILASAARDHNVRRFVQISTAAVQGDMTTLDETPQVRPFSPYSRSKALGERLVAELGPDESITYRPPGVHGADRQTTRTVHRFATNRLSTTVAPGCAPSPQALVQNVADAVAFLALNPTPPPSVVIHPWEGITTRDLLVRLGHREPRLLNPALARIALVVFRRVARVLPGLEPSRRRVEVLWFGQRQASSWLTRAGWTPPVGLEGWDMLFDALSTTPGRQTTSSESDQRSSGEMKITDDLAARRRDHSRGYRVLSSLGIMR